jgi:predicted peptidase
MNVAKTLTAANGEQIAFYEHLPARDLPVIIFFHGQGECGDGTTATLPAVAGNAIPKYIKAGTFNYQFIVLSPQLKMAYKNEWRLWYITEMIKDAKTLSNKAIFLTGLSLGGGACWTAGNDDYVCSQIKAILPISGTGTFKTSQFLKKYGVKTWAFHNEDDKNQGTAPGLTTSAIQTIEAAFPGSTKLYYYTTGGHGNWDRAYAMDNPTVTIRDINSWVVSNVQQKPNMYEWMLSLAGTVTPPIEPPVTTPPRTIIKSVHTFSDGSTQTILTPTK